MYIISLVASERAMYSASVVDKATDFCFLLLQLIGPPPNVTIYPEQDRLFSISPARSESISF